MLAEKKGQRKANKMRRRKRREKKNKILRNDHHFYALPFLPKFQFIRIKSIWELKSILYNEDIKKATSGVESVKM
jgi:hypothetical protein